MKELQNHDMSLYTEPYKSGYSTEELEYNNMKESVEKNKGFYIGRYEAGNDGSGNVLVKKGVEVYNNVPWGNSMTDKGTNGAVYLSKKFAEKQGYTSVTSTLIYGVQWDATMQFFDSNYITGTCAETSYVKDSTGRGHYGATLLTTTGSKPEYAEKNIYDMAGNVFEWTMETYDTSYRVGRGGGYNNIGYEYPVSMRNAYGPHKSLVSVGFRLALYLN